MPGVFVSDGSIGSTLASAFGGGSLDPAADARLLQSLGTLRLQQDQANENRRQFDIQQRLREEEAASARVLREQQAAALKAEEERKAAKDAADRAATAENISLGDTLSRSVVSDLERDYAPVVPNKPFAENDPTSMGPLIPLEVSDPTRRAELSAAQRDVASQIALSARAAKSADDFNKTVSNVRADADLRLMDMSNSDNVRRVLARRGDTNAFDPKLVFVDTMRVKMRQEDLDAEAAKIKETAKAKATYEPLVRKPGETSILSPELMEVFPGQPQRVEAQPDTKDTDQYRTTIESNPVIKNFNEAKTYYKQITDNIGDATTEGTPIDDQALVVAFTKLQDPGSVSREGEVNAIQAAQSLQERFQGNLNYFTKGTGRLTVEARKDLLTAAKRAYKAHEKTARDFVKGREPEATQRGYRESAWAPGGFRRGEEGNPIGVQTREDIIAKVPVGSWFELPDGTSHQRTQ
jgi:hypothetical protein